MVRLSGETTRLLKEDILRILNEDPGRSRFTKDIAKELRRDKEFTLKLLLEMKEMNWVEEVFGRNARGNRKRWRINKELLKVWKERPL